MLTDWRRNLTVSLPSEHQPSSAKHKQYGDDRARRTGNSVRVRLRIPRRTARQYGQNVNRDERPLVTRSEPVELEQSCRNGQDKAGPHGAPRVKQGSDLADNTGCEQNAARYQQSDTLSSNQREVHPVKNRPNGITNRVGQNVAKMEPAPTVPPWFKSKYAPSRMSAVPRLYVSSYKLRSFPFVD